MPSLKRNESSLTTSDQEIPIATSDPLDYAPPLRRSSRVSRSPIPSSSSSRGRRPSVPRRHSPRVPTTIQTTPVRSPPRSRKGKGLHRRTESVSDDPNMSPYRHPSYVAPVLEIPSDCPEALWRPPPPLSIQRPHPQTPPSFRRLAPRARSPPHLPSVCDERQAFAPIPVPSVQEDQEEDDFDGFSVQLPFTTELGLIYDYPPPNPEDPDWFDDMHGNLEADGYIKQLLEDVKNAVAARLYQSTIIELELEDLVNHYDKMLQGIGQRNGKDFEMFLRREAGLLVVPGPFEEGVVHLRRPSPPPQPVQADKHLCDAPKAPMSVPEEQDLEPEQRELIPTEPLEPRSSSPVSSPSNNASFRVQKRRIEAASSIEHFVTFPTSKRRRTTPGPAFRYSPLPPSSPLPSSNVSSSETGSPRPAPARLSPIFEAEGAMEAAAVDSDPSWVPNASDAENMDPNRNWVDRMVAEAHNRKLTPLRTTRTSQSTPPEVRCARFEAVHPYYVPPRSSDLDIPMAWPPRSDEVDGEQDKEKEAGGQTDGGQGQPEASTSFGHSVSAALARVKDKGKARAAEDPLAAQAREFWAKNLSPGAGAPLAFRKYTRQEEDMLWPAYNSNLIS